MQQQTGTHPAAAASTLASGTGPGAEAITASDLATYLRDAPVARIYQDGAAPATCSAIATIYVTHDAVTIAAVINMGQRHGVTQRWERRRGAGNGWQLVEGPEEFVDAEGRISTELGEFMDRLAFPFELANMLPRPASAGAAASIAQAAEEVSRG